MPVFHTDCRHFLGDRPCIHGGACAGCALYDPVDERILLIKLGAMGDVLRTTPLLVALRQRHPRAHLTWVTRPESVEMLAPLPEIDRVMPLDVDALAALPSERFDRVLCLDKEPAATGLARQVRTRQRLGFDRDENGALRPANADADYAYRLGLDDELKFRRNRRTYQEILFEMAGLRHAGEDYRLELAAAHRDDAARRLAALGVGAGEPVVGLNVGAGSAFAHKSWRAEGFAALADRVHTRLGLRALLLQGPDDAARAAEVAARCESPLLAPGPTDSVLRFAALVERCRAVVSGDTLGLHLALALRRPVVAIFGSTCPQEVELYGRGERIVPKIACHPCYRRSCDLEPSCADDVAVESVFEALERVLGAA